jgi:hypothetical protein
VASRTLVMGADSTGKAVLMRVLLALLALIGAPPAPDEAIPRDPARLAGALTATTRELRGEIEAWGGTERRPRRSRSRRSTSSACTA